MVFTPISSQRLVDSGKLTRTLTEDPGEPKVTELDAAASSDEDVLGFDIAMNAVVQVTKLDCPQCLPYDPLRLRLRHAGDVKGVQMGKGGGGKERGDGEGVERIVRGRVSLCKRGAK